jgi:hypothetical protein
VYSALKIAVLMLMIPLFVPGQSTSERERHIEAPPVAEILRPALQSIRNLSNATILLPSDLPSSVNVNDIHAVEGVGNPDGWEISLLYREGCGQACFAGCFAAKRTEKVSRDDIDKVVPLANGLKGYYTARSCGGSCTPPQVSWVYAETLYTIQFNVNNTTESQNEAEVIKLANSAINGGPR